MRLAAVALACLLLLLGCDQGSAEPEPEQPASDAEVWEPGLILVQEQEVKKVSMSALELKSTSMQWIQGPALD